MIPSDVSGWPKRADSDATIRSHEQRQLAAAAEAVPRHGRDERRPEVADRVPALDAACVVHVDRRTAGELADIGAGGKRPLGAAEHDAADRVVAVEPLQLGDELGHQLVGQGVELLRPVQQHDRDRVVALYEDERISRNAFTASCASSPSIERESQSRA